jgi:hypothetical protein
MAGPSEGGFFDSLTTARSEFKYTLLESVKFKDGKVAFNIRRK